MDESESLLGTGQIDSVFALEDLRTGIFVISLSNKNLFLQHFLITPVKVIPDLLAQLL